MSRRIRPIGPAVLGVLLTGVLLLLLPGDPAHAAPARQPNIVLIVVDDMGFSDIGAFGGEMRTPNLDRLADSGVKFSNFHTTTVCAPTRAELLTGVDHHQTGIGTFPELRQDNQIDKPGYEGYLNDRVLTLAEYLRKGGYKTILSGKWHLGYDDRANPAARGFERSFALLGGGHNHFGTDALKPGETGPLPNTGTIYTLDGKRVSIPHDFYSSTYFTDQLISFLPDERDHRPFFAYLAFTAPHYPIQAPKADIDRYRGVYDGGYDTLRQQRLKRLKALGLIPEDAKAHPPSSPVRWQQLSPEQRRIEARTMEAYAAMIDNIDQNVGRLVAELKRRHRFDDTIFMFLSDNGPEGHELDKSFIIPEVGKMLLSRGDNRLDSIGSAASYVWYKSNWAEAGSAPFRLYKSFPTEGGTRVVAFFSYPKRARNGIERSYVSVRDVAPTLLELAGVDAGFPKKLRERKVLPIEGRSFASRMMKNLPAEASPDFAAGEVFGRRYARQGRWKAVHIPPPTGSGRWELFDIETDPGETRDLAREHPEILAPLIRAWNEYAVAKGVVLPVVPGN